MSFVKKYIYFLFVTSLCFSSLPVISAEWAPICVPDGISEAGSGLSTIFSKAGDGLSTMVAEKPVLLALGAATMLLGGGFLMVRGEISGLAQKKYDEVKTEVENQAAQAEKKIEQHAPPKAIMVMRFLKPVVGGIPNYVAYNKWHMTIATIVTLVGHFMGHPWIGAGIGGATLTSGWFGQGFAEVRADIQVLDKKNEDLHAKSRKKMEEIKGQITKLSENLDATKKEISEQITHLDVKLSENIEVVGNNLINLDAKLKDVPEQILQLTKNLGSAQEDLQKIQGSNTTIMQQNNAMVKQTEALSKQLTEATTQFAATKKEFDALGQTLTEQVKKVAEDTKKQVSAVQNVMTVQTEEIQGLKNDMSGKFTKLFDDVTANNKLLQSFENIQTSQGEQLTALLTKINANDERDTKTLGAMNAIAKAQEESTVNYTKIVSNLNEIRKTNSESMETVCAQMTILNEKWAQTDKRVDGIETKYEELRKMFQAQTEQILQISMQNSQLQNQVSSLHKKMDENNALAAETNFIARSAARQQPTLTSLASNSFVTIADVDDSYITGQGSCEPRYSWNKTASFPTKPPMNPFPQGRSRGSLRLALPGSPANSELES